MKIYLLLTEAVQIALISALGGIIIVILGFIFPILTKIFNKQIEIREGQVESHKQMDGMKDELVRTTAELARVKGVIEGRAEMKQELEHTQPNDQTEINRQDIEKLKTDAAPIPVVVTNPEPLPVIVKK